MLFTAEAEALVREHGTKKKDKPFFLYLAHQAVHVGNYPTLRHPEYAVDQAPLPYIERYAWVEDVGRRSVTTHSARCTVHGNRRGNVIAAAAGGRGGVAPLHRCAFRHSA